jgi:hypothetical protein
VPFDDPASGSAGRPRNCSTAPVASCFEAGDTAAGALRGLMGKVTPKNSSGDAAGNGPGDFSGGGGSRAGANLAEGKLTGKTEIAGVDLSGTATGNIGATGNAVAAYTQDGAKIGAAGNIGAGGTVEGKANWGILGANAKGPGSSAPRRRAT